MITYVVVNFIPIFRLFAADSGSNLESVRCRQIFRKRAYPWEHPCLQLADYCLWALQRCYERHEERFLNALWPKVSLVHDVDDPGGKGYGSYLTRQGPPPDPEAIKIR